MAKQPSQNNINPIIADLIAKNIFKEVLGEKLNKRTLRNITTMVEKNSSNNSAEISQKPTTNTPR